MRSFLPGYWSMPGVYHLHLRLVMHHKQFLGHKVLRVARVESMRKHQKMKMMLVVKNLVANDRGNHVVCQCRDQKLLRLFQPWLVLRGVQRVGFQMLEQL